MESVPSRRSILKFIQSIYKGKEDLCHLGNVINTLWKFNLLEYKVDIYRIKFVTCESQKIADDRFQLLCDSYEGDDTHWYIFTEEDVQTIFC